MSSAASSTEPRGPTSSRARLERIISHVGHLLPAQGPISVFIHHNTLHAFEHLPFHEAVELAAETFGCEPYLAEDHYRAQLSRGRIHEADIDAVLAAELGPRGDEIVVGELSRREVRRRILVHGLSELNGPTLAWTLAQTNALREFRRDLPKDVREVAGARGPEPRARGQDAGAVRALWSACQAAVERIEPPPHAGTRLPVRHRDLLHAMSDIDVDAWVHPVLIRVTSAFLDQGLAEWDMPGRERGLFACFVDLYRHRATRLCSPFGAELRALVRGEIDAAHGPWSSLERSLASLGIPVSEWEPFLLAESLALRGFAGIVQQFESRPDRVPVFSLPATLVDFLATRLVLLRAALKHAAGLVGYPGDPADFRSWLSDRFPDPRRPSIDDRAWRLFQVAQLAGLRARAVDDSSTATIVSIEQELESFDQISRRRLLHMAYERHLRRRFFDALVGHDRRPVTQPAYQAVFCIDEREESMRRQLEEVDPGVETFGAAGYFGVAMYYRGATDAHARPLCPVGIRPRHFVAEVESPAHGEVRERVRRGWNRLAASIGESVHLGGRRARRGALLFATVGVLWALPLVLRVVFPWLRHGVTRLRGQLPAPRGRLALARETAASPPPVGEEAGFTNAEMAQILVGQLSPMGIRDRFAPLVLVFGHGSTSLNNPHESAHDCGACGGGRGGPNARAFAQMANDPAVRELAAQQGLRIPAETWFVGGERNTANNDIDLFDVDAVPEHVRGVLHRARASLEQARRREAHERCRRFESVAPWLPPAAALVHVQARANDLAQPRPEYGHATNAVCFVGRRERTRGLFLDRRAFLVSYDPSGDPDAGALRGLLAAIVPVVAGINLEYLFGYVDPVGYGSGTKLPHNVTALVGVMDGAQSDLRTGLPWQMLEIHEPVRLSIVVEVEAQRLQQVVDGDPQLRRLVENRWIFLAALDPSSRSLVELGGPNLRIHRAEHPLLVGRGGSRGYYEDRQSREGRREHLPFAALEDDNRGTG